MNDQELLDRLKAGDEDAARELYTAIKPIFRPWLARTVNCPPAETLDWYHLSFATLLENIRTGKLQHLTASLSTYCCSVGKHLYLAAQRKDARLAAARQQFLLGELANDAADQRATERRLQQIAEALDRLGYPCQDILVAFYYYKHSMDEIAAQFNYKNAASARNQKYRCIEKLRKMIASRSAD